MDIKNINDAIIFSDDSITKRVLFAEKNILTFILNFKPGQTLPPHKHEKSTLLLSVLSGCGEIKVNDEVKNISKGSVVFVNGDDELSIPTVTEKMSIHVVISPNPSAMYGQNFG